jgi:hypothetical protein
LGVDPQPKCTHVVTLMHVCHVTLVQFVRVSCHVRVSARGTRAYTACQRKIILVHKKEDTCMSCRRRIHACQRKTILVHENHRCWIEGLDTTHAIKGLGFRV